MKTKTFRPIPDGERGHCCALCGGDISQRRILTRLRPGAVQALRSPDCALDSHPSCDTGADDRLYNRQYFEPDGHMGCALRLGGDSSRRSDRAYAQKCADKKLPVLSSLMPVIFNAVIVGLEIVMLTPVEGGKLTAFAISALEVGAGELAVCLVLGLPLYSALRHTKLFK